MTHKEGVVLLIIAAAALAVFATLITYVITTKQPDAGGISREAEDKTAAGGEILQGVVIENLSSSGALSVESHEQVFSVSAAPGAKFFDDRGNPVVPAYFKYGFTVTARGARTGEGLFSASEIRAARIPNITVFSPRPDEALRSPLVIRGEARTFESAFSYRLSDGDMGILAEGHGVASSPDAGRFGSFQVTVSFPQPKSEGGLLEVFQVSAKEGSEIDKAVIPVRFQKP